MGDFHVGRVSDGEVSWLGPAGPELIQGVTVSAQQWAILWFIHRYQVEEGQTPSLEEIGLGTWMAGASSAHYQVKQLEQKGLLVRRGKRAITLNVRF